MTSDVISPEQMQLIARQLGRTPRGIAAIAHQTDLGIPVVLRMESLVDDEPFPTLYWLCSRDLHREIAHIETAGWVKKLEDELQEDAELRARFAANHRDYVRQRWEYMQAAQRQRIDALGFHALFDRYGIGGIAQWDKIRCLHMHYAHHLCGENIIGQRLDAEFGLQELAISL